MGDKIHWGGHYSPVNIAPPPPPPNNIPVNYVGGGGGDTIHGDIIHSDTGTALQSPIKVIYAMIKGGESSVHAAISLLVAIYAQWATDHHARKAAGLSKTSHSGN